MRVRPDALLPWACAAVVQAWFVTVALRLPAADGDLLWQRWLGERIVREGAIPRTLGPEAFAANGAPWTPHEWLFSLALALTTDRGAAWILPVACALAAGIALVAVVLRCNARGVGNAFAAAAILLCAFAMFQSFGVRAQVFGWAGLGVLLWLLELEGPWVWAAVPLTLVWANVHASAFLAPAVAGAFALSYVLGDRRISPRVLRASAISAGCACATLLTPLGLDLPRYAAALIVSPIRQSIDEWSATGITSFAFAAGALPMLLALALFGGPKSPRDRVLVAAFGVLLFTAVRNVPVFAVAIAPLAAAAVRRDSRASVSHPRSSQAFAWTTLVAVACAGIFITVAGTRAPVLARPFPDGTSHALLATSTSVPRVFCEDFAWCSAFLAAPGSATVFMDGRCDPFPPALWREYRAILDGTPQWAKLLDARRVDAVLVRRGGTLDSLIAARSGSWHAVTADRVSRLYVRAPLALRIGGTP